MAISPTLGDREYDKFLETEDGETAVRVSPNTIKGSTGNTLDVSSFGMAQVYDRQVFNQLKEMTDLLMDIKYHLSIITGFDNE